MVNKPPKPAKAPKTNKRANRNAPDPFAANFSEGSFFAQSQQFVKENDAKPFRDFGYMVLGLLFFFIYKLSSAVRDPNGSTGIWTLLVFGTIAFVNMWTFFMVQILVKRRGDIGIVKLTDDDVIQYMRISGLFGGWAGLINFGFFSRDPNFLSRAIKASVLNVFWVAIFVKFYL
ncbi:hypothetical protein BGZ80_010735 [Entomortierella chlamydospora]|uniref:Uncharacterized protein n=1 Tax=Entomortierella chlamydospora TaxID=101097 RepID=A0A9P6MUB9_9FUNG|nr:hypothetical protein BGZ79_009430 [Entomortierella chlamydospora]KAG0013982.1 hypothetical protein BGZ80_010735 [Entomortierella chlamydospora]